MKKKMVQRNFLSYVLLFLVIISIVYFVEITNKKVNVLTYNEFVSAIEKDELKEVVVTPLNSAGIYKITGTLKDYKENESYYVRIPLSDESIAVVYDSLEEHEFELTTLADPNSSTMLRFLINVVPTLLLIGLAFYFLMKQMGGANKSMDFGRSRARLSSGQNKVTFNDVAGLTEEKEEVKELIDFLKNPKKFQEMGARIPKGVLLFGPPGTGKTLLARSVAGEANVPFYFISGSEFVELFVGVGASRVRDMFKQAKQTAPCLIFIDEIDAVGRQRGSGIGGGHDER